MTQSDAPALHDQLLRAIELDDEDNHGGFRCQSIGALRAVVELHVPRDLWGGSRATPTYVCSAPGEATGSAWPCSTIAAVAAALGIETG